MRASRVESFECTLEVVARKGAGYGRQIIIEVANLADHSLYFLSGLPSASRHADPEMMIMPSMNPHNPPRLKVIIVTIIWMMPMPILPR